MDNLSLKTNFGKGLPQFTVIGSDFSLDDPNSSIDFNVGLDTGSFVQNFTKPVLGEINKVIKPLEPIKRALTTNLPGLDQIGIKINLLGLAKEFASSEASGLVTFFNTIDRVSSLVKTANNISNNGATITLGKFTLNTSGMNPLPNKNMLVGLKQKLSPNVA
ncbi:hypothetical protein [Scytonema hofmannii]|uniref:hypothetical protein n=1 Tax=Scytonema hofmannii TaxID=34078 RepID=UPI000344E472|nr:hypothetical protein [Scytonema hofmannii]